MATSIWSSSASITGYIALKNNTSSGPIDGIQCCDALDVDNYDETNYRDTFFSTATGKNLIVDLLGNAAGDVKFLEDTTAAAVFTTGDLGTAAPVTGPYIYSATDEVMHVPPRPELKKRTMLRFWSGPFDNGTSSGTGDVVAACWADEFRAFSKATFTFIQ